MNKNFWKNKKVFVTGHTGFKGSWLCLWLHSMGANVTGYSLSPSSHPNLFESIGLDSFINSIVGDIRNYSDMKETIKDSSPEIIIHLAAQALVRDSYEDPLTTYSTNVMGTVNLLEIVRQTSSVKSVVIVSSDKCYENKEWFWGYRENEPLGGYDPYSNSKACTELVTSAYRSSFFQNKEKAPHICSVRAGNVIGGGDWSKDRLIPDIIRAFEKGERVVIRNPASYRPWQYILDLLRGYLTLAENLYLKGNNYSEAWNFGPSDGDTKTVEWIVENLANFWGGNCLWEIDSECNLHEARHLKLDSSKAKTRLAWQPIISIDHALRLIVEWHASYRKAGNMYEESLKEIRNYEELLNEK